MGIGLLGRGVGDIDLLASCGANITATDLRTKKDLAPSLKKLKKHKYIDYVLEKHKVSDFRDIDMLLYAAGVPKDNKYLQGAKESGTEALMSFALLVKIIKNLNFDKVKIIGVTGSKGKSTTVSMIESVLKASGMRYHLGGNVRGVSNLQILKNLEDGDVILAELDSWQLQSLHDIEYSPNIAVFTSFFKDHMNYYNNSMEDYFYDKSAIFKYQTKDDVLVYSKNAQASIRKYRTSKINATKIRASFNDLPVSWEYHVFGEHVENNLALAYHATRELGVLVRDIKTGLTNYQAKEGRFQYLGKNSSGVMFFNDNNSTTPQSTILSLSSLKEKYPKSNIILIAGGSDKNFNYRDFATFVSKEVSSMLLFPGAATEKIIEALPKSFDNYTKALNMGTAVNLAVKEAQSGDIIILSPASASFGLFKNEYDRNDQYLKKVRSFLKK